MRHRNKLMAAVVLLLVAVAWLLLPARGVPILAYHTVNTQVGAYSISPAEFEQQLKYLADNGYTAISLAEFFAASEGRYQLPEKPVIITFDDGYADNYLTALPIMEKYGMRATVFVISGAVGQPNYLTWEQIKAMQARHTEIGSHTVSHVALGKASQAERRFEVTESKRVLEANLGAPVEFLAYPYGSFDKALVEVVKETGYRGACTGTTGLNGDTANPYKLKRINIPRPRCGLGEFKIRLLRAELYSKLGL